MPARPRRSHPRPRRLPAHRSGLWPESLEARRLLAATPVNLASSLVVASGLPLPGLAIGSGFATTAQQVSSSTAVTVAPSSVDIPFVATPTGPAPTLSPLMSDFETANAAASEQARPTPGVSDRISVVLTVPETVPIPHLRFPGATEVIPGPEIQDLAPAPAPPPVQPPADPVAPLPAAEPAPAPVAQPTPNEEQATIAFEVWDTALGLLATEVVDEAPAPLIQHTEATLAAGALLAAWTGWKHGPRAVGRTRRRPRMMQAIAFTPEDEPSR